MAQDCIDAVVKKHVDSTDKYTAGTDDLSGLMTSVFAYIQSIFSDIRIGIGVIILMGPVASGVSGFAFVFVM